MASKGLGESAATASRTQKVALISGITGQVSLLLKCCRVGSWQCLLQLFISTFTFASIHFLTAAACCSCLNKNNCSIKFILMIYVHITLIVKH